MATIITHDELVNLILNLLQKHFEESNERIDLKEGEMKVMQIGIN